MIRDALERLELFEWLAVGFGPLLQVPSNRRKNKSITQLRPQMPFPDVKMVIMDGKVIDIGFQKYKNPIPSSYSYQSLPLNLEISPLFLIKDAYFIGKYAPVKRN